MEPDREDPSTWDQAACLSADPEVFFPEKGGSTDEAKRICARCALQRMCLTYALIHEERFGVWGGFSERERRSMSVRDGREILTERERRVISLLIVSAESLVEEVGKRADPEDRELLAELERTRANVRRASEEVRL